MNWFNCFDCARVRKFVMCIVILLSSELLHIKLYFVY